MGLKRYLDIKNWYSNDIILLFERQPQDYHLKLKSNHNVKQVDNKNIADTQSFEDKSYTQIYEKMLSHGDIGIFGYIDNECAGRLWGQINPKDVSECGVALNMENDSIFLHYVETAKQFQRQGLFKEMLGYLLELCNGKKVYVTINLENEASIKAHKQFGFKEIAVISVKRRAMKEISFRYNLY